MYYPYPATSLQAFFHSASAPLRETLYKSPHTKVLSHKGVKRFTFLTLCALAPSCDRFITSLVLRVSVLHYGSISKTLKKIANDFRMQHGSLVIRNDKPLSAITIYPMATARSEQRKPVLA